jgi:adenylate kinase
VLDKALLERGGKVDVAPYIRVPEADLVARLGGRWICRAQGHPYHEQSKKPLVQGVCDVDGSELYQRTDDQPATVQARLRQQLGALDEVVGHYREHGVLATVDGSQPIDRVTEGLLEAIAAATGRQG